MNSFQFSNHKNLEGLHAPFSASQPYWLGKSVDENINRYISRWIPTIGTVTHAFAETMIQERIKLSKSDMKLYKVYLLDNDTQCIPRYIVDYVDLVSIFENLMVYVNDAIGFRMTTEQLLVYSDIFFGTADAISFDGRMLRIHDLKTGTGPVKMDQLMIYAALFCLEYKVKPETIDIELRIYQNKEVKIYNPEIEDIRDIMNQIIDQDKELAKFMNKEV